MSLPNYPLYLRLEIGFGRLILRQRTLIEYSRYKFGSDGARLVSKSFNLLRSALGRERGEEVIGDLLAFFAELQVLLLHRKVAIRELKALQGKFDRRLQNISYQIHVQVLRQMDPFSFLKFILMGMRLEEIDDTRREVMIAVVLDLLDDLMSELFILLRNRVPLSTTLRLERLKNVFHDPHLADAILDDQCQPTSAFTEIVNLYWNVSAAETNR